MDVWQYIAAEGIDIPELYFSHEREVVEREGTYLAKSPFITLTDDEEYVDKTIRFRTIGDMTCTGAFESEASTIAQIIEEVASARITERGNRTDDKRAEAAMEERKKEGYF
jgi:sulfate adenylyltransferase subunit 2